MTPSFRFGPAFPPGGAASFRLWAPDKGVVDLLVRDPATGRGEEHPMARGSDGFFAFTHERACAGWHYAFRVDGEGPFPDPASRWQPEGVHGWSELTREPVRREAIGWNGIDPRTAVLYELHIGTFTPEGTYAAAAAKIPYLKELGITVVELMPLAEFPGRWNWGYDGTFLFAPAHGYGTPDDLRALVAACQAAGIGVILDVVYNHFGPDGNYLWPISRRFFTSAFKTPWGDGVDIAHPVVATFFEENIRYWIRAFGVDGFRLDAVHALDPDHRTGFLKTLALAARREATTAFRPFLVLENRDNQAHLLGEAPDEYDAQWNDDYRYALQALLQHEEKGVYADFLPASRSLLRVLREGFAFQGEYAAYYQRRRGSRSSGLPAQRFINFIQSHDVPGNRPLGERLHQVLPADLSLAAGIFTLLLPGTPLIFMGDEFQATSPFLYFTDHEAELGSKVRAGRLEAMMRRVAAEARSLPVEAIPDPQAESTLSASKLNWPESLSATCHPLYAQALAIRHGRLSAVDRGPNDRDVACNGNLYLVRMRSPGEDFLLALHTGSEPQPLPLDYQGDDWLLLLSTQAGATPERIPPHSAVLWARPDTP